jgi:hypothetical protein
LRKKVLIGQTKKLDEDARPLMQKIGDDGEIL